MNKRSVSGRCWTCNVVYAWEAGKPRLKDAYCPVCGRKLRATTHLYNEGGLQNTIIISGQGRKLKMIELPGLGKARAGQMDTFVTEIVNIQRQIGFKVSARGWCYQLEQFGLITKAQFDKVENLINGCRRNGSLAIDFTAEEESRKFSGIEVPEDRTPLEFIKSFLEDVLKTEDYYTPDWWDGEKYYIQMLVEKIDLKTLFAPVCEQYHIPIATSKGWSSMLQRGEYARRFKEAEDIGLNCVLMYCGDYDPDGLRISDFLRSNLADLSNIYWRDGTDGYNPNSLIIDRFGLNYDFIVDNNLSWINNLITGSKKNLASPSHPNHYMEYVQSYLRDIGERKCEANALVVIPAQARDFCRESIERYIGPDALARFQARWQTVSDEMEQLREATGVRESVEEAIKMIDEEN